MTLGEGQKLLDVTYVQPLMYAGMNTKLVVRLLEVRLEAAKLESCRNCTKKTKIKREKKNVEQKLREFFCNKKIKRPGQRE